MKKFYLLLSISVFLIIICSCASSKMQGNYNNQSGYYAGIDNNDDFQRKIIYNATVRLVAKNPDTAVVKVIELAKKIKGYMVSVSNHYVTLRIPSSSLKNAMKELEQFGKIKDQYIYTQDITDEFRDLSIRLENAEKARTRYLELLQKAQNVEETLKVEKELERLNTEIDIHKGKIKNYQHLEEYSTLAVNIQQKTILGPLGYVSKGVYYVIKFLFVIK